MPHWPVHASFAVVCLGIPFGIAYRSGSFGKTWRAAWIALVLWFGLMAFLVGPLVGDAAAADDLIPDGPSVVAALAMGWIPAGILAAVAMVLARLLGGSVPPGPVDAPSHEDKA
ncbi:MAG: hypothetical protein JNL97_02610 [Verrucomicrobiales bacterium]|nr:hypothetical protein [Verrucomicrobiales bacterium]